MRSEQQQVESSVGQSPRISDHRRTCDRKHGGIPRHLIRVVRVHRGHDQAAIACEDVSRELTVAGFEDVKGCANLREQRHVLQRKDRQQRLVAPHGGDDTTRLVAQRT